MEYTVFVARSSKKSYFFSSIIPKMRKYGGTGWCVTQTFPAGGQGGAVSPPAGFGAEPRRQTHFGNVQSIENWVKIMYLGRRLHP